MNSRACGCALSVLQIPRILSPIAEAVRSLEEMALDPALGHYVDVGWGGVHNAKMAILSDFFKVHIFIATAFVDTVVHF